MENLKNNVYLVNSHEQAIKHGKSNHICDCNKFINEVYWILEVGVTGRYDTDKVSAGLLLTKLFSDYFGIPMIITSKYISRWWVLFDSDLTEDGIKRVINCDINKFVRKWERKFIMVYLEKHNSDIYVICNSPTIEPLDNANIIDLRSATI